MIKSMLAHYPFKRVVLWLDHRLLSVNNFCELAKLQASLAAEGRAVILGYVLAVPAARDEEFAEAVRASISSQTADKPWVSETTWQTLPNLLPYVAFSPTTRQRRLVIAATSKWPRGAPRRATRGSRSCRR